MRDPICQVGAVLAVLLGGAGCSSSSAVPERSDAGDASHKEGDARKDARIARDASPVDCGGHECGGGNICVAYLPTARPVEQPLDGGACLTDAEVKEDGGECVGITTYACVALPAGCDGVPTCACSQALCTTAETNICVSATESLVSCTFYTDAGGRPFLVSGEARVAPTSASTTWGKGALPNLAGLSAAAREQLGGAWTRIAQMEHASVAAFARFALELMALGAPADLLRSAQGAMADEIDHAERAFTLASAYHGRPVGPGVLDVGGALSVPTPESVLATLVREGCIGETLAAVEAAEALEHATDPAVRATLAIIVRDETAHAALAFRAARWIVEEHGLRSSLAAEFARALEERRSAALPGSIGSDAQSRSLRVQADHGMVNPSRARELQQAALSRIVAPQIALLAPGSAGPKNGRTGAVTASVQD
jgi:hypothetical protein